MAASIVFRPIGVIHSPFTTPEQTPIQPTGARNVAGTVEVFPEFVDGLADLDGFSHIFLIYHFHLITAHKLTVTPFLDDRPRGLFATRAPARPNPAGLSVVRLSGISGGTLHVLDCDILDGTPLLDIKPYVAAFDRATPEKSGWLEARAGGAADARDDGRFIS